MMTLSEKLWDIQKMGSLKPGATYIYERNGGTVYAREAGADPSTRVVIGYSLPTENNEYYTNVAEKYFLEVEWSQILKAAKDNMALQEAIERVKIIYHLSKEDAK